MSIETTVYPVRLHTASSAPEAPSHRLVVLRWKDTATKKAISATRFVSIPMIEVQVTPTCLATALRLAAESIQDAIIRRQVEADLLRSPTVPPTSIAATAITPEAMAAYSAETATSSRLTKEIVESWFDLSLREPLELALAATGKITSDEQLATAIQAYKSGLAILSGPHANYQPEQADKLISVIQKATDQGETATKLIGRLETMKSAKKQVDFLL